MRLADAGHRRRSRAYEDHSERHRGAPSAGMATGTAPRFRGSATGRNEMAAAGKASSMFSAGCSTCSGRPWPGSGSGGLARSPTSIPSWWPGSPSAAPRGSSPLAALATGRRSVADAPRRPRFTPTFSPTATATTSAPSCGPDAAGASIPRFSRDIRSTHPATWDGSPRRSTCDAGRPAAPQIGARPVPPPPRPCPGRRRRRAGHWPRACRSCAGRASGRPSRHLFGGRPCARRPPGADRPPAHAPGSPIDDPVAERAEDAPEPVIATATRAGSAIPRSDTGGPSDDGKIGPGDGTPR